MNASPMMAPAWFMLAIVGIVVVTGIVFAIRAAASGNGRFVGLLFAGLVVGGVLLGFIGVRTQHVANPPLVVYENNRFDAQHGGSSSHSHAEPARPKINLYPDVVKKTTDAVQPEPEVKQTVGDAVQPVPEAKQSVGDAVKAAADSHEAEVPAAAKPVNKPAWLTQGTQTGNGISQFPVSSELFATVGECQRDLDTRMPALIAEELRFLVGEEAPIPLLLGEARALTAETFTEEVPTTSQGNWYKVHRLIKVDQVAWAGIHERFQHAKMYSRLKMLGLSFGGLMLTLGVVYLVLRRNPRVVDPTLNTFSTT